ncbi:MAG: sugar phosphate isomerase/epimerase [Planctomycetes bacterium]|nr:sugar phosphate isomerase/epimerase [Planctomycetota bacterium]
MRRGIASRVFPAAVVLAGAMAAGFGCRGGAEGMGGGEPPAKPLGCRLSNYGKYQDEGWRHLASIGIRYAFLGVPAPEERAAVERRLAESGLASVVLRGSAELAKPDFLEAIGTQLATCEAMGVRYMFLSAKRGDLTKDAAYERLRRAGDLAREHGVTIALETHPDLGTNADVQLETMRQVNHPNVRVNFDTGNISYYNAGRDAAAELEKVIEYVATVELKDHDGKPESWYFPALGRGVVDLAEVVRILERHRFAGPVTMEIEGVKGVQRGEAEIEEDIAESAAYVRTLGRFR